MFCGYGILSHTCLLLVVKPTLSNDHEKVCATLHAMCIYQIEGLLSQNRYNSKLATAVLHHEYLVRVGA